MAKSYLIEDKGCKLHPLWEEEKASCLTCPLPKCRYDGRAGPRLQSRRVNYDKVMELVQQGRTIERIARELDISVRTVYRIRVAYREMITS